MAVPVPTNHPPPGVAPAGGDGAPRRALLRAAAGLMLAMTTWFSTAAVLPALRLRWDLSTNAASALVVVLQLGFVAGALVSAVVGLADRVDVRRLVAVAAVGAAVTNVLIVPLDGFAAAIVLRFLTGAFLAGVYPPALKFVATWFRAGRGLAMGAMVAALTVGSAAPHLVNGFGGARWEIVMIATSAATVVGGAVFALGVSPGPYPFPRTQFSLSLASRALRDRPVVLASLGYLGHMWELYAMWAWIAAFLADAVDRSGSGIDASLLAFTAIAAGAVGSLIAGAAADRVGSGRSARMAMLASGSVAAVIGWGGLPLAVVVALAVVWGVAVVADSAQFSAIVTERAEQAFVGTALTVQLAFGFLLTVTTMWLVPLVRDGAGWWWAFAMLAPGPLLGAWAMSRLAPADGGRW
ncbi:MAG: MFS transporter [Acidimicrobiales bacterium]